MNGKKPFSVLAYSMQAFNSTNIADSTGGTGGAGKVTLEKMNLIIQSVVLDYGAVKFESFAQDSQGTSPTAANAEWSRINNTFDLSVD